VFDASSNLIEKTEPERSFWNASIGERAIDPRRLGVRAVPSRLFRRLQHVLGFAGKSRQDP
jgi:hypothetical protein